MTLLTSRLSCIIRAIFNVFIQRCMVLLQLQYSDFKRKSDLIFSVLKHINPFEKLGPHGWKSLLCTLILFN